MQSSFRSFPPWLQHMSTSGLYWPLSMRPRHHDRFVPIGLCWLNGRSGFSSFLPISAGGGMFVVGGMPHQAFWGCRHALEACMSTAVEWQTECASLLVAFCHRDITALLLVGSCTWMYKRWTSSRCFSRACSAADVFHLGAMYALAK